MEFDFWQTITSLSFVVTFSLVVGAFLPLVYSIYSTWEKGKEQVVYEVLEQIDAAE
jgi:hypothetical protein